MPERTQFDSLNEIIHRVAGELLEKGTKVAPRGMTTFEITPYGFTLKNPRARVVTLRGRKWDPAFCVAEFLWYMRGSNSLDAIAFWAPSMRRFTDDQHTLHGAYGFRMFKLHNTFKIALDKLRTDPDSRQAVVPIFEPRDVAQRTKDMPCTLLWHFMIRDGKLNMYVDMRSNDVLTGTTNDVFAFTMVQEYAARLLGVEVGEYHHYAHSMHLYTDTLANIERWAKLPCDEAYSDVPEMSAMPPMKLNDYVHNYLEDQMQVLQDFERGLRDAYATGSLIQFIADVFSSQDREAWNSWTFDLACVLAVGAIARFEKRSGTDQSEMREYCANAISDVALATATQDRYVVNFEQASVNALPRLRPSTLDHITALGNARLLIIEGPDKSGKTTFVKRLTQMLCERRQQFQFRHFGILPAWWDYNENYREAMADNNGAGVTVFDRFTDSELVYGPIMRGQVNPLFTTKNREYIAKVARACSAVTIYCDPGFAVIAERLKRDKDEKFVDIAKLERIYEAYHRLYDAPAGGLTGERLIVVDTSRDVDDSILCAICDMLGVANDITHA